MHTLIKLFYLIIFSSFDILLYLRLGKKIVKVTYWLIGTAFIWLIVLMAYLPVFNLNYLMPLKDFGNLSRSTQFGSSLGAS